MATKRAAPAPTPQPPALTKDQWISEFTMELARHRDVLATSRFAHLVAGTEWVEHHDMDPREAARQWVSREKRPPRRAQ